MNIIGFGIDIIHVDRFKKIPYKSNKKFYMRIFNKDEIEYCLKFQNPYQHFAAKYALKEAVKKSIKEQISFLDIVICYQHDKPIIKLKNHSNYQFLATISHEKNIAIAAVISF